MPVSMNGLAIGGTYSRQELALKWGYAGIQAIARGVVTPRDDCKIILFVTEEKQSAAEQYKDKLVSGILIWEGPKDHFAEERLLKATETGDQIYLFYRSRHHSDFTYFGEIDLAGYWLNMDAPSSFTFRLSRNQYPREVLLNIE